MSHLRIAFIGAGNMAASLIGGLRAQGMSAAQICASEPGAEQRARISAEHGITVYESNQQAISGADLIVLAVKPQIMKAVCLALAPHLQANQLIVSIAAGISCASLNNWLGTQPLVRCMPNTPALVRQGVSGLFANAQVSATQREQAEQVLSAVGMVLWLDNEAQIDAVTAVSGSGPAYLFLLAEAMQSAAEAEGLAPGQASVLVAQTLFGAARMLNESHETAAELRRRVTSPKGTTEAAIHAFEAGGFRPLVKDAIHAARIRGAELSAANDGEPT